MPKDLHTLRSALFNKGGRQSLLGAEKSFSKNFACWLIALPVAVITFLQLKKATDKRRLEDLKKIQQMNRLQTPNREL